ncbi:MAG: succinate dehydrogenase, hydrophobic membrane anchor protein [Gammaproteobacteria bacterium]|nr:succinate dehydrogenase, hydrophobic membrane anchor protein [Gammaproteobacteria bacterium]
MGINFIWLYRIFIYMKGSLIWNIQRYSSLFILAYVIYIFSFFIITDEIDFLAWSNFFKSFQVKASTSIVFLMIVLHAYIGLWTIGTDYLTNRTLGFLSRAIAKRADLLRSLYFFIFGILGIFYLITILYIVWL